jgi:ABC-type nitrate/sulfonate/bicarbonate transport system permease component
MMTARRIRSVLVEAWLPVVLLALWWWASAGSTALYFPSLSAILRQFQQDWLFRHVGSDLVPSLEVLAMGYLAAVLAGLLLGVALGLSRRADQACRPLLEFLRAIPGVALLPVFVVLFDLGAEMKIVLIATGAVWPVLLNTIDGVRSVEPLLLDMARTFRLSRWQRLRRIVLPSAGPQIFAGARTALAIAVVVLVVGETVGSSGGIGYFLLDAERNFAITSMWGAIVALGVLGYLLNVLFRVVEAVALRWHRLQRARLRTEERW